MPESPLAKILPGVVFVLVVAAAAFATLSPIKAWLISKPRKASSTSDSIELGERETPMPRECRIPSNFVTTFRKAIHDRSSFILDQGKDSRAVQK